MALRNPKVTPQVQEVLGDAQQIIDNYYYMYECISACIGELQGDGNLSDIVSVLESAKSSAGGIIVQSKLMEPDLRARKMEQLR